MHEVGRVKVASTRWLLHEEGCKKLVSRFESLLDALDTLINRKAAPDIKGIRDELLGQILFLCCSYYLMFLLT